MGLRRAGGTIDRGHPRRIPGLDHLARARGPDGETIDAVAARADRVMARARAATGDVLVFAHGHLLRVLAARWLDLPPTSGALFALETATVSILGWERDAPVIETWNAHCGDA